MNICNNCQNKFSGKYCNICGEKIISAADFSVKNILLQAFEAITNFDGKLLKTFTLMFQNPGKLAKKIISGVRVPYFKPFQIFIICNLVFFIFLSDVDFFRIPSEWFFDQNVDFIGKVMDKVENIMKTKNLSLEEVKSAYDSISSNLAKSLLILLIPFIALFGILLNKKLEFGKHLIFATLYFSQFLLCTTILYLIIGNLPVSSKWYFIVAMALVGLIYYIVSIKAFYQKSLLQSISYGIIGFFVLGFFISVYRDLINLISLSLV